LTSGINSVIIISVKGKQAQNPEEPTVGEEPSIKNLNPHLAKKTMKTP